MHADDAGAAAARVIRQTWDSLWLRLRTGPAAVAGYSDNVRLVVAMLHWMQRETYAVLRGRIGAMLTWAHERAVADAMKVTPRAYLAAAAGVRLKESRGGTSATAMLFRGAQLDNRVLGGRSDSDYLRLVEAGGVLDFGTWMGQFDPLDLAAPIRDADPAFPFGVNATPAPVIPDGDEYAFFRSLLFPPLAEARVRDFLDDLFAPLAASLTKIGTGPTATSPHELAGFVASQLASGISTRQLATQLRPAFDGSAVAATRAARTFGAYVGTRANLETAEAMGDLIIGYQVHSAGGENARHDHALRSGTVYYRTPKAGQVGMDVMPEPPVDRGGPHEDARGTRWNCRCWLTPVLAPLPAMSSPAFTDNAGALIPDVAHYSDWWQRATPAQQRAAVGVRRLQAATDVLGGRAPPWEMFVDPKSSKLMTVDRLKKEGADARAKRLAAVGRIVTKNRAQTIQTAAFGTV